MILDRIVVGSMQVNCYILGCSRTNRAVVIDPGNEPEKIKGRLKKYNLKVNLIINTHGHIDHIGANDSFSVPVYIHQSDVEFLNNSRLNLSGMLGVPFVCNCQILHLEDGQKLTIGEIGLEVIHTPGHTPGSICLNAGKSIFTGDTLFARGIGRTDIPRASAEDLLNSIRKKLLPLEDEVTIYPGHGPCSTVGEEKRSNPFI